jgi:hypothetical protein
MTLKDLDPNKILEYRINTKDFMKFTSKERLFFYKIIRLLRIYTDHKNTIVNYIYFDLTNHKRFFENNLEFSLLEKLTDEMFAYKLDTELMYHPSQIYGQYFQQYTKKGINENKSFTIVYVFCKILTPRPIYLSKTKPKKKVFKRGYRDHGSLGSEISKTLKDQSRDYTITEKEIAKKKMIQDLTELYLGAMDMLG